jgi:hypothetical protein
MTGGLACVALVVEQESVLGFVAVTVERLRAAAEHSWEVERASGDAGLEASC